MSEATTTEQPPFVVTDEQAALLASHAIHVQGGFSTPENERERLVKDVMRPGAALPDEAFWSRIKSEVDAALAAKEAAPAPDNPPVVDQLDAEGTLDLALVRRYKELRDAAAAADAEKAAFKEEADALEAQIVEMFSEAGVPSVSLDGKTVHLKRTTFAQWQPGYDIEEKKRLLREAGAGDLVTETINSNTLAAYVRELVDVDDAPGLPESLKAHLDLGEKFNVGVRASASKSAATKRAAARSKS